MPRTRLLLLTGAAVTAALAAAPATGSLADAASAAPAGHAALRVDKHRPTRPVAKAHPVAGGVRYTWGTSTHATRYRVQWAPAAFDQWPGAATFIGGWLSGATRSATHRVPTNPVTDKTMTALPYGNPVFGQVQANNAHLKRGGTNRSSWVIGFPLAPTPGAGDPVRMGSYNILGRQIVNGRATFPARVPYLAKNIADHGLTVVSLQEVGKGNLGSLIRALEGDTHASWSSAKLPDSDTTELNVIYRTDSFTETDAGTFTIDNYRKNAPMVNPWVRLRPAPGSAWTREFYVVPAHFVPSGASDGTNQAANNRDTGANAREVISAVGPGNPNNIDSTLPIIIAGDYTSNSNNFGDTHPAQPTFVRAGFWDAMAAPTKANVAFGTVNKQAHEQRANSGLGGRADAIFLRGFNGNGSVRYVNVANWYGGGPKPPSDHNLIYADLRIPES